MSIPDLINGTFELSAGLFTARNCVQLYHDKMVRGISVSSFAFFTSWGFWNLYFYPSLHQWLSFTGGLSIVTANCVWLGLYGYYARTNPRGARA